MQNQFWQGYAKKESASQAAVSRLPRWVTPNSLTVLRILLAAPIVWLLTIDNRWAALAVFLFAFVLDFIDGPLARVRNQITVFGKLFDPLADKIVFLTVLVVEGQRRLPGRIFWTIIALEIVLVLIALIGKWIMKRLNIHRPLGANIWGKIKMNVQVIGTVLLLVLPDGTAQPLLEGIFWLAVVLAGLSIIRHVTKKGGDVTQQQKSPPA